MNEKVHFEIEKRRVRKYFRSKFDFFDQKLGVMSIKFERKSFLTPFHTSDIDKNKQKEYTVEYRNLTRCTKTFINWVFSGAKTRFLEGRR